MLAIDKRNQGPVHQADAHCLDGNGVPALSGDKLGAKGDRGTRDLVEDLRDDGIVLVRVRADAIASHGYLPGAGNGVHDDYDPRRG